MLLTLDWLWGRQQALLQQRNVSSVHAALANCTKWMPSQNWGNLLSELHVPHISVAFSASFTSISPSFPQFYCTPNKACLLCATPAGTYQVQSPGFLKIVYSKTQSPGSDNLSSYIHTADLRVLLTGTDMLYQ